ncbi:MAG: ferrous iron transport protein A [Ignavibacteriae bacterium]|nr:ferrous iron transport protein A [Ignavibacteriota bacterium]
MKEVSLSSLSPGERGKIARVATQASVRQRLLEMGLVKGTPVEFVRSAPMGDPIEVSVKGYRLSLRRVEAQSVFVVKETK